MIARIQAWRRARREAKEQAVLESLKARYHAFRVFLENNGRALELIGLIDHALSAGDDEQAKRLISELCTVGAELVDALNMVSGGAHPRFYALHQHICEAVAREAENLDKAAPQLPLALPLSTLPPGLHNQVGPKAANLAQLKQLGLPVPEGFVVATAACRLFLESAGLTELIRRTIETVKNRPGELAAKSEELRRRIEAAELPDRLRAALGQAWRDLWGDQAVSVSARSSAAAEDRRAHSFAGQFESVLNITGPQALEDAYRRVVASNFSARAVAYRLKAGLAPVDFNMAVLCQRMVNARCAGLVLTSDPSRQAEGRMLISAVAGLGTLAVGGSAPADLYRPSREENELHLEEAQIAAKEVAEVAASDGGLRQVPVAPDQISRPLLGAEELRQLVRYGRRIEALDNLPQDIEWAFDSAGALHILQARPLRLPATARSQRGAPLTGRLLASGMCASPGKAVGRVRVVRTPHELEGTLQGRSEPAILLLPQGMIDAGPHLCDFAGVIADLGNPADHLSNIAREYGVPMITGTLNAAAALAQGSWVVVDADHGRVYEAPAEVWKTSEGEPQLPAVRSECAPKKISDPVRDRLRQMIVPLNLTNAYGPTYSILECRSLHDLVRLAHESVIMSMFGAGDQVMAEAGTLLRKVEIGVPFQFVVIDLGGGLAQERRGTLGMADILSHPLAALCRGLATPDLSWHSDPPPESMTGLISGTLLDAGSARPIGEFNYALAARDYLNLNARVEFHFAMLDATCGEQVQANHIRFRFKGGGTGEERCRRRARFVSEVLEANGFLVTMAGDLVTAGLVGAPRAIIEERLTMIGRLLGYSRLLDAVMNDDEAPLRLARGFLAGRYDKR